MTTQETCLRSLQTDTSHGDESGASSKRPNEEQTGAGARGGPGANRHTPSVRDAGAVSSTASLARNTAEHSRSNRSVLRSDLPRAGPVSGEAAATQPTRDRLTSFPRKPSGPRAPCQSGRQSRGPRLRPVWSTAIRGDGDRQDLSRRWAPPWGQQHPRCPRPPGLSWPRGGRGDSRAASRRFVITSVAKPGFQGDPLRISTKSAALCSSAEFC